MDVVRSIIQNPLFLNLLLGDFHLLLLSPAVNSADPAYMYSTAFDGTARPQGGGPDVGAYER